MKKFKLNQTILNPVFSVVQENKNESLTLVNLKEEKISTLEFMVQLTALMLTLPAITALLLVWFNIK